MVKEDRDSVVGDAMIRYALCFALAAAVVAGAAHAAKPHKPAKPAPPAAEAAPVAPAPADEDDLHAAIMAGRAIPNRAGLTLVLTGGRHLTMSNDARGCPVDGQGLDDGHCYRYVLLRNLPDQHAFVVDEIYYEGDSLLLVDDRTGRQTGIDGMPVFSPDGTHFLVIDEDEANDHDNNLEIWRRDGDTAGIEWAHPVKQVQVEAPGLKEVYHTRVTGWSAQDDLTLAFTGDGHDWTGHLTRGAKGWVLSADWPKP